MNAEKPIRLLLGPQRPVVNLDSALARSGIGDGPIGVISAAWQEAEGDIDGMQRLVKNPLSDLLLYQKAEALFAADTRLHEAYRRRQEHLKEQQRLYRLRLRQLKIAARATLRAEGEPAVLAAERRHAISQLRALDKHHLRQVDKIHARFDNDFNVDCNTALAEHTSAFAEALSRFDSLLITGGNVVVLINRLRLFGLGPQLQRKNIVAWSAGAMVLADRIVLFHERMPQGRRDAEIMCRGMAIVPDTVLLPNASGRLRLRDSLRIGLFDRRFSPATCVALDNGSYLLFEGETLRDSGAAKRMTRNGKFKRVRAA
ncbi:MAG: Type 1 glutamine amidotransferase-like domain-containing protein [Gammaproteobacteria bacterium]|nr:Type 1 glutamine amidotransferase-like domain-containing protein [Gammaproteobacteria bacterium]MBT8111944.1 Type 1 glutamine amidotransferase-like domain-containing protein [Gammaproteobacteria bacterium]NND48355.1 type 1 glutamine amidotransferase-like domain-containing protein [Woeseiaceae bacterium]NNL46643.1 type 1 glutamine amidotransferase-like domain-containing protein [Woeseiaceae bacterium]